jgi:hypothetical protein
MMWLLGRLGLHKLFGGSTLKSVFDSLMKLIKGSGYTDVIGTMVNILLDEAKTKGIDAVRRMVTIKASSLDRWARDVHGSDEEAVADVKAKYAAVVEAITAFAASLIPKNLRFPS